MAAGVTPIAVTPLPASLSTRDFGVGDEAWTYDRAPDPPRARLREPVVQSTGPLR